MIDVCGWRLGMDRVWAH